MRKLVLTSVALCAAAHRHRRGRAGSAHRRPRRRLRAAPLAYGEPINLETGEEGRRGGGHDDRQPRTAGRMCNRRRRVRPADLV